jgi:hypothetical protein
MLLPGKGEDTELRIVTKFILPQITLIEKRLGRLVFCDMIKCTWLCPYRHQNPESHYLLQP